MKENIEYVQSVLSRRDLLEALSEECGELTQASLKLIRAEKLNKNMTPVTKEEARANVEEEAIDVLSVMIALGFDLNSLVEKAYSNPKWGRLAKRLEEQKRINIYELVEKYEKLAKGNNASQETKFTYECLRAFKDILDYENPAYYITTVKTGSVKPMKTAKEIREKIKNMEALFECEDLKAVKCTQRDSVLDIIKYLKWVLGED